MKIAEMRACAADTLRFFIQTMPDAPFTEADIIIEFAPKAKMAERAVALCARYVPDKIINESQAWELNHTIRANALIGRKQSAVIIRIDYKISCEELREVLFHELAHIFCLKLEMGESEHFIEVYGSGTTPERGFDTHEEKEYDGKLVAGHKVWSEFIVQYYALYYAAARGRGTVARHSAYIEHWLSKVTVAEFELSKGALSYACARFLACEDADERVQLLKEPDDEASQTQHAFWKCLFLLHDKLKTPKPWAISEAFIADLGQRFMTFRLLNSIRPTR